MEIELIRSLQADFFRGGKTRDLTFRLDCLLRLGKYLEEHEDELLDGLHADLGKPKIEAYLSEIYFPKSEIRLFRKKLKTWTKPVRAGFPFYHFPIKNRIHREPYGCSLIIAPWNYPFQLSLSPLIASVAAGNCVTLKPSELAPATSANLARLVEKVFEPEHVTVVQGDAETAGQLLKQPFDTVFFTGSKKVGKIVARSAAEHLAPTILELSGKCPVIVDKDIDLKTAANRIAAAKFLNAGQICFAPDFLVAHHEVKDELVTLIRQEIEKLYRDSSDLAKVINPHHYERLLNLVNSSGESLCVGRDNPEELRLAPRLLPNVTWTSPAMEDEVFGPVLPILSYSDESDLIEQLQKFSSPLALYIFTDRKAFSDRLISAVPSGSVCINDLLKQSTNLDLPFGGVGGSGMGRYRGRFGFEAFTYQRPVTKRWLISDPFAIQPPYAGKFEKSRKFLK